MNNSTHYIVQVLSIIFTVFTLVRSTAHKELIDLVMAVKECGTISNLECVSKTKIRGVIALLKLATIIETHGGSNEKVLCRVVLLFYLLQCDALLSMKKHYTSMLLCFDFCWNIAKFKPLNFVLYSHVSFKLSRSL